MALAINFPQHLADPLMELVETEQARLIRSSAIGMGFTDYYEFDGCEFRVDSIDGRFLMLYLIKGELNQEALTFAVLKGKIEST